MTLFTLFMICFLVGVGVSAVSLVASGLHFHHHGGFHVAPSHGGHGGGHSLLKSGSDFVSQLFNLAAITIFLTCFGGVGLLLGATKLATAVTVIIATAAGFAGAAAITRVVRALRRKERPLEPITLIGTLGTVTIPIREGGTGEVVYTIDGKRRCSGARSDDSKAISRGSEVVITRYDKGIAYVCEFDRMMAR